MPRLSDGELAAVVVHAGWTGQDAVIAFAVARAESGGVPEQIGFIDHDDLGLFQVNRRYHPEVDRINWRDPVTNAQLAHQIWSSGGWGLWVTYKNGSYLRFLSAAQAAIKANPGGTIPIPTNPGFSIPGAQQFNAILDFFHLVSDRHTWIRIGEVVAGLLLVAVGLFHLTQPVIKPIAKAGITAAKVAA